MGLRSNRGIGVGVCEKREKIKYFRGGGGSGVSELGEVLTVSAAQTATCFSHECSKRFSNRYQYRGKIKTTNPIAKVSQKHYRSMFSHEPA